MKITRKQLRRLILKEALLLEEEEKDNADIQLGKVPNPNARSRYTKTISLPRKEMKKTLSFKTLGANGKRIAIRCNCSFSYRGEKAKLSRYGWEYELSRPKKALYVEDFKITKEDLSKEHPELEPSKNIEIKAYSLQ